MLIGEKKTWVLTKYRNDYCITNLILKTHHRTSVNAKKKVIANTLNSLKYLSPTYFGSKLNLSLHYPFLALLSCRFSWKVSRLLTKSSRHRWRKCKIKLTKIWWNLCQKIMAPKSINQEWSLHQGMELIISQMCNSFSSINKTGAFFTSDPLVTTIAYRMELKLVQCLLLQT